MNRIISSIIIFFLLQLFLFASVKNSYAALFINEFSSDTEGTNEDPDWVEIYNNGPDQVDLSLYRLRDNSATNKLDLNGIISSGGFIAFDWSFKLNKSGDVIKLFLISNESNSVDQVDYGDQGNDVSAPSVGQSAGRRTDGDSFWVIFSTQTKGKTNNSSTPVSTSSPTPTKVPTNTTAKTQTPTKKVESTSATINSPTAKITVAQARVSIQNKDVNLDKDILGQSGSGQISSASEKLNNEASKEAEVLSAFSENFGKYILLAIGMILISSCAILFFLKYKKERQINE